jgi:hypothetical protein
LQEILDLLPDLAQLQKVEKMPGAYLSLFLLFALIVMVTSLGGVVFLRQKQAKRAGNMDNNAWFLILLIIVAILSIGCFIAFIFFSRYC